MSGGDDSSTRTGEASGAGGGPRNAFGFDYLSNESHEHSGNRKAPIFNGDASLFEWSKPKAFLGPPPAPLASPTSPVVLVLLSSPPDIVFSQDLYCLTVR